MTLLQSSKVLSDTLLSATRTTGCSWSWRANRAAISSLAKNFSQPPSPSNQYNRFRYHYSPASNLTTATYRWSSSNASDTPTGPTSASASTSTSTLSTSSDEKKSNLRIPKTLAKHVWPSDDSPESKQLKQRVVLALSLMLAGKVVTIQVPYIFKGLVDTLQVDATSAIEAAATLTPTTLDMTTMTSAAGIPVIVMLMSYGMSRAAASGFQELRNAVFANVTQEAIRKVGGSVFNHVHTLDMQFHLTKNTGTVSRILDRGNRSISFVLNAMVFHVAPTTVEVGLVTGLVYYQFGLSHASVVLATIVAYTGYTMGITNWRTKFRRDMNRLENQASGRVVDSLVNYETVQFFNNRPYEV